MVTEREELTYGELGHIYFIVSEQLAVKSVKGSIYYSPAESSILRMLKDKIKRVMVEMNKGVMGW